MGWVICRRVNGQYSVLVPCSSVLLNISCFSYANMDFIFASAIRGCALLLLLISYDIACQWFINFFKRMKQWPEHLRIGPSVKIRAVIPKFHEPAHTAKDHAQYCLHWLSGGAQCDCEGPERIWSPHNALGNSTKTQGPGHRHDTLNCHFAFWNFLKYISMGMFSFALFLSKMI
jgi:hypothetical protein